MYMLRTMKVSCEAEWRSSAWMAHPGMWMVEWTMCVLVGTSMAVPASLPPRGPCRAGV